MLILSMHSTARYVFHALEAGVHSYILKESAAQEVVRAVQVVASNKRYPVSAYRRLPTVHRISALPLTYIKQGLSAIA